eukprot:757455-Amphidinium_carterae.1
MSNRALFFCSTSALASTNPANGGRIEKNTLFGKLSFGLACIWSRPDSLHGILLMRVDCRCERVIYCGGA